MPIFEYRCRKCSEEFEQIVFRQSETIHCPKCDSGETEKLFSSFAVSSGSGKSASLASANCGPGKFT